MAKSVFISYCHNEGDWVWDQLVPCLRAGGADVRVDRERFEAGKAVIGQMDKVLDSSAMTVLVLSPDYLNSPYCVHEMERAIRRDPKFAYGIVVSVKRVQCALPAKIKRPNPLYVDLQDDSDADQWDLLLRSCKADLHADAPHWLEALHKTRRFLKRGNSVNLVVQNQPRWYELISEVKNYIPSLGEINLDKGSTASRKALVEEILRTCGANASIPDEPNDLVVLQRVLSYRSISHLAMIRFDMVKFRPTYDVNLFAALRALITDSRKLVLLIESREAFVNLLPANHPFSKIESTFKTVELNGSR